MFTEAQQQHVVAMSAPWAIMPGSMPTADLMAALPRPRSARQAPSDPAVIDVTGVIEHQPGLMSYLGMGTSCESISRQLRLALLDDQVTEVVLRVSSPGGSVFGVQELAAEIYAARAVKPITAFVEGCCASAALWLASQADRIVCQPSGQVGSIGVYTQHADQSGALQIAGVKVSVISAGQFKVEDSPFAPLSKAARAHAQDQVNVIYRQFVSDVARGRGVTGAEVRDKYGKGRMLDAQAALKVGLIDAVSASWKTAPKSGAFARKKVSALARNDVLVLTSDQLARAAIARYSK